MSRNIFKKRVDKFSSLPFQFQSGNSFETAVHLEAEAELDAFDERHAHGHTGRAQHHHAAPTIDVGELIERAQQDANALLADARSRATTIEREAYERGLEEGRKTGEIMAEQQLQAVLTNYHASLSALDQLRELMISQNQLELLELIVFTAQKVVHTELSLSPQTILPMVKQALQSLKARKELTIYLNGDDYEFVSAMAEQERQKWIGTQSHLEVDSGLGRGSFRVETQAGELDASIEVQLEQLRQNLAATLENL